VDVVGVSFDPPEDLRTFRKREGLKVGLASDPDETLARRLGLVHKNVIPGKDAFFPTKVLVDRDGRVLWAFAEDDLRVRLGVDGVIAAIDRALPPG
jgi:peroxiredoxin